MEELKQVHHVSLTVTDLERSVSWYVEVLGMVERFREERAERTAAILGFPGGASIGLVEHGTSDRRFDPAVVGLDHFGLTVSSPHAMQEWSDHLTALGVEHSGAIDVPPGQILNFKDPDGIALCLFWDRA
jgi:glyoxylase I family protein